MLKTLEVRLASTSLVFMNSSSFGSNFTSRIKFSRLFCSQACYRRNNRLSSIEVLRTDVLYAAEVNPLS